MEWNFLFSQCFAYRQSEHEESEETFRRSVRREVYFY